MKKWMMLGLALAVMATALPATAGDYKCEADAQSCLTKMSQHLKKKGWVGIEMDKNDETGVVTIAKVVADSPAEKAGFMVGDALIGFNGIAYKDENKAKLKEAGSEMVPGNTVTYTVKRDGEKVNVEVHLAKIPETVMAQWIGHHMLEHHVGAPAEKEKIAATP